MSSRYVKGDPRAIANGRKGGQVMRSKQTPETRAAYQAGWIAGKRASMQTRQGETA